MFVFSKTSLSRRIGVNKKLIEISDRALELSLIDFGIPDHGGVRTKNEQNGLYKDNLSKCDGYDIRSKHQDGKALDIYAYVDGRASWEEEHITVVAAAMLQAANELGYVLKWGGLWKRKTPIFINGIPYGWDMCHFELG